MSPLAQKNIEALDKLAEKNPLTFPMSAYIDYAHLKKVVINRDIIREVEESYFGRFDSEVEFIQAVQGDYGKHWYPTPEKIYKDFISVNKRYFKKTK